MIITPPFTEMQKKVIEATEKLANKKKLCDVDEVDDISITNFDKVTASLEALEEFIKTIIDVCYTCDRDEYPQCTICWCNPIALKNWLMAEVEK